MIARTWLRDYLKRNRRSAVNSALICARLPAPFTSRHARSQRSILNGTPKKNTCQ